MLAYRPLKRRLDNTYPSQMPRINRQALWQVQPDSDGVRHLRFIFPSPEGGRVHFSRYLLILKASMLMNEWKRRHAFFQSQSPSIGLPDGLACDPGCRLAEGGGIHLKNEEETAWEAKAAETYTDYVTLLNRLHDLEISGAIITGYSPVVNFAFDADSVPLSLFALPSVPGSDDPPGDRIDSTLDSTFYESYLAPAPVGRDMVMLLKQVKEYPSLATSLRRYIRSWLN